MSDAWSRYSARNRPYARRPKPPGRQTYAQRSITNRIPRPPAAKSGDPEQITAGLARMSAKTLLPDELRQLTSSALSESRRWWARMRFEDLPTLAAYFPGSVHRPEDRVCSWCGRREWWQSKAWPDVVRCGWCSAPAPGAPVVWLNRLEGGPMVKPVTQEACCCAPAGPVDV
jgi:hypothetical protein